MAEFATNLFAQLVSMEDKVVVENDHPFQCPGCRGSFQPSRGVLLRNCLHTFCRKCLIDRIEQSAHSTVGCPYQDSEYTCTSVLQVREIKALVGTDRYEAQLEKSLEQAEKTIENTFHCLTADCRGWCIYDGILNQFKCPICSADNCLKCRTLHNAQVCKQQEDKARRNSTRHDDSPGLYVELVYQDHLDLIEPTKSFDCSICYDRLEPHEGVVLRDCLHVFCKTCLQHSVRHSDQVEITCPYRDTTYSCESNLQEREIKALGGELYEVYLAKSIQKAECTSRNAIHCQTPNCRGWWILEDFQDMFVSCPVCGAANCVKCKAIHPGISCEEFILNGRAPNLADKLTEQQMRGMIARREAMYCPGCGIAITKIAGCDGVTCSKCGTDICWATLGPRWGPKGKGDTSGGCRCGVNGRKCHPSCANCH